MATDLILKGRISCKSPAATGFTDLSSEVTQLIIKGMRADVAIPATLATPKAHAAGAAKYEVTIEYFSTDGEDGSLFPLLWTAVLSDSKELNFKAALRDGAKGPTNPEYTGTFVVSAADLGGDQEALSTGAITCTLTGAPTVDAS